MLKCLSINFKKYLPTVTLPCLQKRRGLNHIIFLFYFFFTVLLIFFNIIRYIFFFVGKLFPKTAIFKGILLYLTTFLEYFLVSGKIPYSQFYCFGDLFNYGLRVIRIYIYIYI